MVIHRFTVAAPRAVFLGTLFVAGLIPAPAILAAEDTAAADRVSAAAAAAGADAAPSTTDSAGDTSQLQTIMITAQRLNVARTEIETQTGAST
ncbi:MAG TPA: hypothetical protein VGH61_10330, partial [Steroidobacteraceae bacterium]